ncbi:MAG: DUF6970 domain-containing protein [Chitinophagaceae bacterium]
MRYFILILLTSMLFSCTKKFLQAGASCIQEKINDFKSQPKGNPPRSITQYSYKHKIVFYVPPQCCDQFSDLFDENCNLLGHPDGGITGRGDGTLPNFFTDAKDAKIIWKDDR